MRRERCNVRSLPNTASSVAENPGATAVTYSDQIDTVDLGCDSGAHPNAPPIIVISIRCCRAVVPRLRSGNHFPTLRDAMHDLYHLQYFPGYERAPVT